MRIVVQRLRVVFIWLLLGCIALWAAEFVAPLHAQTERALKIDVVVMLDDSGSMATCWPWPQDGPPYGPPCGGNSYNPPSDPNELRYSAARLLIALADPDDRIAVLRFDSGAEGVGSLGRLQEVGSRENRRRLAASLQPPPNYGTRGYTRMDLGLQEALRLLTAGRQPNRSQYVLLLTDGEPTAPDAIFNQRETVSEQLAQMQAAGVQIYPVLLCNPNAGCPGDFLKNQLTRVQEAKSAPDILRIFSEVFAEMKSDRSVVSQRNVYGNLAVSIREEHGVGELAFIAPQAAISSVRRDAAPMRTVSVLADDNVDLLVAGSPLPAGEWTAETSDLSSFAVVQADSFPELLFPPPSIQDSPASVRFYPAGQTPLLVVRGAGPAADEPLLLNGTTRIPLLGQDGLGRDAIGAVQLTSSPEEVMVQLGEDENALQLRRSFRLVARTDLPNVQVHSPSVNDPGILGDGSLQLRVGFGPGLPIQGLQATAFVMDITEADSATSQLSGIVAPFDDDSGRQPVYQKALSCRERICTDNGFVPQDGHSYEVLFLLTAMANDQRFHFGSFARALLDVEPAVYVRGLPPTLDLLKMPAAGWTVTVQAGTSAKYDIGSLVGSLTLRRVDSDEVVSDVALQFAVDVPATGSQTAILRMDGLDLLRPGAYEGDLRLSVLSPAGLPMDVLIRPAPSLPVMFTVSRAAAHIAVQEADFGELPFDTSPNFRLDETILLPVDFVEGTPFRLTVEVNESTCDGLTVTAADVQFQVSPSETTAESPTRAGLLPLRLQSQVPVLSGGCSGVLRLLGPSEDFDVLPNTLPYRLQIRGLEWRVAGSLHFGDLGLAGEQATASLLLRFDGKTPFVVQVLGLTAAGETDEGPRTLDESFLEAAPIEISGTPDADGYYEVPITLVARKAIPKDPLYGSFYSGDLVLGIAGLPNETRSVDASFRSPTFYQRYVEWWLRPFYTFPLVFCSGPLFFLLLLVIIARTRGRGYNIDEEPTPAAEEHWALASETAVDSAPRPETSTNPQATAPWPQDTGMWGSESTTTDGAHDAEQANSDWNKYRSGSGNPWASDW